MVKCDTSPQGSEKPPVQGGCLDSRVRNLLSRDFLALKAGEQLHTNYGSSTMLGFSFDHVCSGESRSSWDNRTFADFAAKWKKIITIFF